MTIAKAAATIRLAPAVAAQAGLSAMQWIWLSLGGLVLILVVVMGGYALRHRRRQAPA
jgi:type VI protein secretion system component VasF